MGTVNTGSSTFVQFLANSDQLTGVSNGRLMIGVRNASGAIRNRATSGNGYNDGEWHHVVGTWAGGTSVPDIYVDGALDNGSSNSQGTGTSTASFGFAMFIGARNLRDTADFHFNGQIDEAALYDKVLSAARIEAHYNAGVAA